MTTTREQLQIARDLLNHNIGHMRAALRRRNSTKHDCLFRQALKKALDGNRQVRGRLDIVATALTQSPDPDPL